MSVEFISGKDHYEKVVARVASVRKSLWIGTADIKDLHVKVGNSSEPFLAVLAKLLKRGVEVRLIHAKEPGPAFREDFDRYPILKTGLERMLCPRVLLGSSFINLPCLDHTLYHRLSLVEREINPFTHFIPFFITCRIHTGANNKSYSMVSVSGVSENSCLILASTS